MMNYELFFIRNWQRLVLYHPLGSFPPVFFTAVRRCRAAGQGSEERWSATQGQRPEEYGRWHQWVKIKINYSKFIPNLDQPLFTYISYIFTRGESVPTIHSLNAAQILSNVSCSFPPGRHAGQSPAVPWMISAMKPGKDQRQLYWIYI